MSKRIAIVGLGKIGLFHLSILRNLPDVEIVALADPKKSAQGTVKGMDLNIPFYESIEQMCDEKSPDGVFCCVPPAFNLSVAKICAARGISTFLEKPMAADLSQAKQILDLAGKSPKKLTTAVGYMVAYYPLFQKAKELVKNGSLGDIKNYSSSMLLGEVFQKQEGWRQNPKISGGGSIAVLGSHLLFLLQDIFGLPKTVQSKLTRLYSQVEDIAEAKLTHDNFSGDFMVSWSAKGYSDMAIEIKVSGTTGSMTVTENSLTLETSKKEVWYPWDIPAPNPSKIQIAKEGYVQQDYEFVSGIGLPAVAGSGASPKVAWANGYDTQRLVETIYKASETPDKAIPILS